MDASSISDKIKKSISSYAPKKYLYFIDPSRPIWLPIEHFTHSNLRNQPIDEFYVVKKRQSTDFELENYEMFGRVIYRAPFAIELRGRAHVNTN